MDTLLEDVEDTGVAALSYDETISYEEQLPEGGSLVNRIGNTKVYLLADSSVPRAPKRKHNDEDSGPAEDAIDMEDDPTRRGNALLFRGPPISQLPTARIFAYATHFDAHPLGLEWIDDTTCVLVFESKADARAAVPALQKSPDEEPDINGFVAAKPIPVALWPPKLRINSSLGKDEGLKGPIALRWATFEDVKQKGAKRQSEFYKKHGETAGKEVYNPLTGREEPPPGHDVEARKRRRGETEETAVEKRARLDDDLDAFLREGSPSADDHPEPPSKMRSDQLASDGRSLLERTSVLRVHSDAGVGLSDRITAPLPGRRRRGGRDVGRDELRREPEGGGRRGRGRRDDESGKPRQERPKKSQQELDDELDAFLRER